MANLQKSIKAYVDLTRLQFFFVWPLLFCSGLFLSFVDQDGFSLTLVMKAALIGFLGFEAGLVLNDYVDRELDKRDVEFDKLTRYWRLFGKRPIAEGLVPPKRAFALFVILVITTSIAIMSLSYPHSIYVFVIMAYSYCAEYYYQVRKRRQAFPIAQLIGRTDFTFFPVAGYLSNGSPGTTTLLYFLFFYPFAMVHLGVNDIVDIANDRERGMKTIPLLYGIKGTVYWIQFFTAMHLISATLFLKMLGAIALIGFTAGSLLLLIANFMIMKGRSSQAGLKALPFIHATMLIYAASIILDATFRLP